MFARARNYSDGWHRYHGSFLKQQSLWIVMEYCSGGSCSDLVSISGSGLSEQQNDES